ncbi:MAG: hypothetical protein U0586_08495 [Candidatus Brocadiaceae bacterium]
MTRTMRFDGTPHVVIMHCALSLQIATLFCHCERSKAIFLS